MYKFHQKKQSESLKILQLILITFFKTTKTIFENLIVFILAFMLLNNDVS